MLNFRNESKILGMLQIFVILEKCCLDYEGKRGCAQWMRNFIFDIFQYFLMMGLSFRPRYTKSFQQ